MQSNKKTANTEIEIWRSNPRRRFVCNYQISNLGRVKNKKTKKLLKHNIRSGYKSYNFHHEKLVKSYKIHRLLAELFVPNDNPEVKKNCQPY